MKITFSALSETYQSAYNRFRNTRWFSRRNESSLISNVLFLHMTWGVFIYAMAVFGVWWTSTSVMHNNLQDQARRWLHTIDEISSPFYISKDPQQLAVLKQQLQDFEELSYVRYISADGNKLLGEYQAPGSNILLASIPSLSPHEQVDLTRAEGHTNVLIDEDSLSSNRVLRAVIPVWIRSIQSDGLLEFDLNAPLEEEVESTQLLGYIDLGLDFNNHYQRLIDNIIMGSLIIAAAFMLLLLVGRIYLKRALKPLEDLQVPLARLARGDMRVKVRSGSIKEVNAISEALNTTISAIRERDRELNEIINHDTLTHLTNRRFFTDQVISELLTIEDANHSSAILFLDLDEFKAVNDTLGHDAGDRLLIQVAKILQNRVREYDVVSRFGGDEFVILTIGASKQDAQKIAKSILDLMRSYQYKEKDKCFNVYCSIGIAMINHAQFTVDQLIKQADSACQQAKIQGRNGYCFYDASDIALGQIQQDANWSGKLRDALLEDRFIVHYQPIVSNSNDSEEIYEVLLRLDDGSGTLINPQAFMGAAERFGLATEITNRVIDQTIDQLCSNTNSERDLVLSINLAGSVLEDQQFVGDFNNRLRKRNISFRHIIFEVQESFLLHCPDKALHNISLLHDMGCRIAIDGFGSALNASSRFNAMPFDYLKISHELMDGLAHCQIKQTLVKTIIELAQVMEKQVVAGFIQDQETLDILRTLHVDFLQGYLLGKPNTLPGEQKHLH